MIRDNTYTFIFLPLIIFIGIVTSYQDWKESKIKNKWIFLGLLSALVVYVVAEISYFSGLKLVLSGNLSTIVSSLMWKISKWGVNLSIATVVAYCLWYFKIWGAGDGKLFICYAALIPMGQYSKVYFNYNFASLFLLLAIFIPATFFLFIKAVLFFFKKGNFTTIRQKIPKLIKDGCLYLKQLETIKIIFGFLVFFLLLKLFRQEIQGRWGTVLDNKDKLTAITLLVVLPFASVLKKNIKTILVIFVLILIYVIIKQNDPFQWFISGAVNSFISILVLLILLPIFKRLINSYVERTTQKTTPFAHWMFLGALLTWFI